MVLVMDMFNSLGVRNPSELEVVAVVDLLFARLDLGACGLLDMADFQELSSNYTACEEIVHTIRSGVSVSPTLSPTYSIHDRE